MVNGVELVSFHQPHQVRKFQRDHAVRLEQGLHALHKVIANVRHLGQHVVAENQIGLRAVGHHLRRQFLAKKLHQGRNALVGRLPWLR